VKRIIGAVALLGLCACGGGGAVEGGQGSAEPAPAPTSAARNTAVVPTDQGPVEVPKELCGFLEEEVPRINDGGSRLVTLARFAADYAGWVGEDANRALATASELDAITTSTCPQVRSQVLKVLKRDSLAKAVGR